jgi:hypothetical protein
LVFRKVFDETTAQIEMQEMLATEFPFFVSMFVIFESRITGKEEGF